jgi:hypothetical protein
MRKYPVVTGVPVAVNVMVPVPGVKLPAGAFMVIPFTVVLVNAEYDPPELLA